MKEKPPCTTRQYPQHFMPDNAERNTHGTKLWTAKSPLHYTCSVMLFVIVTLEIGLVSPHLQQRERKREK